MAIYLTIYTKDLAFFVVMIVKALYSPFICNIYIYKRNGRMTSNLKKKCLLACLLLLFLVVLQKKKKKYNKWIVNYGGFLFRDAFVLNVHEYKTYYVQFFLIHTNTLYIIQYIIYNILYIILYMYIVFFYSIINCT